MLRATDSLLTILETFTHCGRYCPYRPGAILPDVNWVAWRWGLSEVCPFPSVLVGLVIFKCLLSGPRQRILATAPLYGLILGTYGLLHTWFPHLILFAFKSDGEFCQYFTPVLCPLSRRFKKLILPWGYFLSLFHLLLQALSARSTVKINVFNKFEVKP